MSLSLPEDLEVFGGPDRWHSPGCYCLTLDAPDDITTAWETEFDVRPPWVDQIAITRETWYVGAASDVLARLEDHRDGEVRKAAILRLCDIDGLRNVWWYPNKDEAFIRESKIAIDLQNAYPDTYVHCR